MHSDSESSLHTSSYCGIQSCSHGGLATFRLQLSRTAKSIWINTGPEASA
jgi:hypothetical protein